MTHKRQRAVEAFKRRLVELARKEGRCPACLKAQRLCPGTLLPPVCWQHQNARHRMAFGGRKA